MSHHHARTRDAGTPVTGGYLQRGHGNGASVKDELAEDSLVMGNSPLPPQLAVGPSVILDDGNGAASIPASQLFSQAGTGPRLARQRPRFHSVQDLDLALNQAIEGRINSKNAWASKEASDLLEGITHTIESTLDANTADDYSGFTKAATVVEGCSKVWTVRVDSTYQQSNQMLQRLLRNEEGPADGANGGEGSNAGDEDDDAGGRNRRRNQRAAAAAAAAAAARTLALNASEINLDSKAKTALTQTGINAQFRAITEKFDQGNAQGLLLNNAPLGGLGNVILDVDYARVEGQFSAKKAKQLRQQEEQQRVLAEEAEDDMGGRGSGTTRRGRKGVKTEPEGELDEEADARSATARHSGAGTATTEATPRHSLLCVEHDRDINMTLDDLPDLTPAVLADPQSRSSGTAAAGPGAPRSGRASAAVDALLVLPHAAIKTELLAEGMSRRASMERPSTSSLARHSLPGIGDGTGNGEEGGSGAPEGEANEADSYGYDDGDWGGGGGEDDDTYNEANVGTHGSRVTGRDVGDEARALVSGVGEMDAVDAYFGQRLGTYKTGNGHDHEEGGDEGVEEGDEMEDGRLASALLTGGAQLALEAEDPSSWCPLTDASTNPLLAFGARGSVLSQLRKRHHIASTTGTQSSQAGHHGASASAAGTASPLPPAKRGRKEKTVVFDLSEVEGLAKDQNASAPASVILSMTKSDADSTSLKQSSTATKNVTPLGKEILLGKEASHNVLLYTQSVVQKAKAERANLVLPADPVPGESIPNFLAFPIAIDGYFQPFCTQQSSWNMLRKSASGRLLDSRGGGGTRDGAGLGRRVGAAPDTDVNTEDNMPVAFFAGGAETDDIDGGDYDDANDFYYGGGEDEDGDMFDGLTEEEAQYRRAELQLLRQFDAQQQQEQQQPLGATSTGADIASVISSAIASARSSGQLLARMDALELVRVLQSPEAVHATQVDVVKLRQTMWSVLQELAGIVTGTGDHGKKQTAVAGAGKEASDDDDEEEEEEAEDKEASQRPRDAQSVLKQGLLRALAKKASKKKPKRTAPAENPKEAPEEGPQGRLAGGKRARGDREDGSDTSDADEDAATPRPRSKAARNDGEGESSSSSSSSSEDSSEDDDEEMLMGNFAKGGKLTFSDVVEALLPQVSAISSTGTLSPAFFFFSILFLANEHSIVLKNVKTLDDLVIDEESLIKGGGEIKRRTSPKRQKTGPGQTATRSRA